MKIAISGIEVLSIRYRSFDELTDEYVDHETKRGRRVPDYDLGILLTAIGIYTLKKTADELIREVLEIRQRRKGEENARTQSELKKKRHSELLDKTAFGVVRQDRRVDRDSSECGGNAAFRVRPE